VLQCVCSVLHLCCSALQCDAARCSVLQCVFSEREDREKSGQGANLSRLQCVALVLQLWCSALQCDSMCCSEREGTAPSQQLNFFFLVANMAGLSFVFFFKANMAGLSSVNQL